MNVPNEGVYLGDNIFRGATKIKFLRSDKIRHHYVIRKSGSGKSVFLNFMARRDIWNGDGVCGRSAWRLN